MGGAVKKVASVALPVIGVAIGGPLGAPILGGAIGGALGGVVSGGGVKGALLGAAGGALAGGVTKAGGFGNFFKGLGGGIVGGGAQQTGSSLVMGVSGLGATGQAAATNLGLKGISAAQAGYTGGFASAANKNVSFLGQTLASKGGYALQTPTLSKGFESLGKDVLGVTGGPGGMRETQLGERFVQKDAGITGLFRDREGLKDLVVKGYSALEGDLQQQQIDALQQNLDQYQDQFAGHYAAEAKKHQDALARGELPETYNAALDREAERLKRLLIAQGHNPAESGFGRDQFKRGLMDLESKFIQQEREYWRAIAGGADTMTSRITALKGNLAQTNVGARSGGEFVSSLVDATLGTGGGGGSDFDEGDFVDIGVGAFNEDEIV